MCTFVFRCPVPLALGPLLQHALGFLIFALDDDVLCRRLQERDEKINPLVKEFDDLFDAIQNAGADASPVSMTAQAEVTYGSNLYTAFIATAACMVGGKQNHQ